MARRGTAALPRVTDRAAPITIPTVSVEVQSIAILVVVAALWFLASVVTSVVTPVIASVIAAFLAPLFSPIIAIRVSGSPVVTIAGNFSILEIRISRSPSDALILVFSLFLGAQDLEHRLQPLSRYVNLANGPYRG